MILIKRFFEELWRGLSEKMGNSGHYEIALVRVSLEYTFLIVTFLLMLMFQVQFCIYCFANLRTFNFN